jgi:DNA-binding GntR family transcriptional regulator
VDEIRSLIHRGVLLPGEQIRQAQLAERLGVSRIPVREALKVLQTEWVVSHEPNIGFAVARFEPDHLAQIYLMRSCLEREMLRALPQPSDDVMRTLEKLNARFADAAEAAAIDDIITINREFHFRIFELSPLDLVRSETVRLWDMSEFYRSVYAHDPVARERVVKEHDVMLKALARGDNDALVRTMEAHRDGSRAHVMQVIRPSAAASFTGAAFVD